MEGKGTGTVTYPEQVGLGVPNFYSRVQSGMALSDQTPRTHSVMKLSPKFCKTQHGLSFRFRRMRGVERRGFTPRVSEHPGNKSGGDGLTFYTKHDTCSQSGFKSHGDQFYIMSDIEHCGLLIPLSWRDIIYSSNDPGSPPNSLFPYILPHTTMPTLHLT